MCLEARKTSPVSSLRPSIRLHYSFVSFWKAGTLTYISVTAVFEVITALVVIISIGGSSLTGALREECVNVTDFPKLFSSVVRPLEALNRVEKGC